MTIIENWDTYRQGMKLADHPRIAVDPEICGGRPTIAGTRMRVTDILAMLAEGVSEEVILTDFPYVKLEDIRASLAYAASTLDEKPLPPGYYTLETLPPLSEGAKAILASIDAVAPLVDVRATPERGGAAPGITLEDEGLEGIRLSDEGLPGLDPDN
jgi:uncharacterized protein (DUF433 family)